jgi:uncharacterized protein YggT (Ycf19 family)
VSIPLSEQYEQQAKELEDSSAPIVLKATRVLAWVVYVIVLAKCALLVTSFVFQLLGANPDSSFASWVYRSADRSMDPFRGIFPTKELSDNSVLDLSLLFAAVVYVVLAILIDAGLKWLGRQLSDRDRRIRQLQGAARDARVQEYRAEQDARARQLAAQQAAAEQRAADSDVRARHLAAEEQYGSQPPAPPGTVPPAV